MPFLYKQEKNINWTKKKNLKNWFVIWILKVKWKIKRNLFQQIKRTPRKKKKLSKIKHTIRAFRAMVLPLHFEKYNKISENYWIRNVSHNYNNYKWTFLFFKHLSYYTITLHNISFFGKQNLFVKFGTR